MSASVAVIVVFVADVDWSAAINIKRKGLWLLALAFIIMRRIWNRLDT